MDSSGATMYENHIVSQPVSFISFSFCLHIHMSRLIMPSELSYCATVTTHISVYSSCAL